MHRNIAEDEFSSDREHSDNELDGNEDFLSTGKLDAVGPGTYDHQSKSNVSIDDEENLPGPPSSARSETTAAPWVSFTPSMELAQEPPETTQSNAIPSSGPSHQFKHLEQCKLSYNEPNQIPTTAQMDLLTETSKHIQKSHKFDLNACICGSEVFEVEIKEGDTIMQCKVPGCETEWVCKPHPHGFFTY